MRDLRMYILINEDIKIGKGKLAGQVGHAVNVLVYRWLTEGSEEEKALLKEYMESGIKKVLLKAPQKLLEELEEKGEIRIRDRGYTQLEPNTLTCVNLGIHDYADLKKEDSSLLKMKLY